MDRGESVNCSYFREPLSVSDLLRGGSRFEIETNFNDEMDELDDELNLGSDDDGDEIQKNTSNKMNLTSPWLQPFDELKKDMVKINDYLYKRILCEGKVEKGKIEKNCRVYLNYNAYWEGEGAPFDSTYLRGSTCVFYTDRGEVIEGLEIAAKTMYPGEQAQFLISYHLLYRELGCPPRVKPKADGLFIIELHSFTIVGDLNADEDLSKEDRAKFPVVIGKAKDIHLKGLDFFGQKMYKNAIRAFEKAVQMLKFCSLANEEEEREQKNFLVKLYTNLMVCFIKIDAPSKTCIVMRELRRITNNKPSCKAIFQEGRALLMLGEYKQARVLLIKAQNMEPHNQDICKELIHLEKRYSSYKENEKLIWQRALQMDNDKENQSAEEKDLQDFEKEILDVICNFKSCCDIKTLSLPKGLSDTEIKTLKNLAESLQVKLEISPLNDKTYNLCK